MLVLSVLAGGRTFSATGSKWSDDNIGNAERLHGGRCTWRVGRRDDENSGGGENNNFSMACTIVPTAHSNAKRVGGRRCIPSAVTQAGVSRHDCIALSAMVVKQALSAHVPFTMI